MKSRHTLTLLLLTLLAFSFATSVEAATVLQLDLPDAVGRATQIIHGSVLTTDVHWSDDGRRIYTDATIEIHETLKGVSATIVVVRTLGGIVGGVGQMFPGAPKLTVGEEVVLLLQESAVPQPGAPKRIVGLSQGVYRVRPGTNGVVAFQDLRGLHRVGGSTAGSREDDVRRLPLNQLLDDVRILARRSRG